jgi:hypothetical protein
MFSDKIVNTSPLHSDDHFHWTLLQLGGAQFMLNTNYETDQERPLQPEQHRNIAHRDTCLYVDCPDVDGPYLELQNKGLRPEAPTVTYYGMKEVSIADPDGYKIFFHTAADPTRSLSWSPRSSHLILWPAACPFSFALQWFVAGCRYAHGE